MEKMPETAQEFLTEIVAATKLDDIKGSAKKLRALITAWQRNDKLVMTTARTMLRSVTDLCQHLGAQRGYNERDGSWMSPCPVCGHSE